MADYNFIGKHPNRE